ncbi:MAG TPA: vWA domain-containing protein [Ktedonobacteraceae bacterium]|nr:vWA domain-containing protein [Ktedonobacteraceae bacterium]
MPYEQQWGGRSPGCLIFLLDQSGSMSDVFGFDQAGGGRRKCDMVATVLNGFIHELIVTNTVIRDNEAEVRPRADIAVIGYEGSTYSSVLGGDLEDRDFVTLPELQDAPLRIETRMRREIDETGRTFEEPVDFPIWVDPMVGGGTPMCLALGRAQELAQQWADEHPYNYPPVIIHVTDGMSTDGDPRSIAQEICQISTTDGQALLFNVHITNLKAPTVMYPSSEDELPHDKYAQLLFSMSSYIPETSRSLLSSLLGSFVPEGARGLIFNGDAASVRQMFVFASVPATQPLDPNR